MKSLEEIKNEYALSKKCSSWENFCFVANDNMFVRAVDEIATLYADYCARLILAPRQLILQHVEQPGDRERFG
jgi:hypothetical protein